MRAIIRPVGEGGTGPASQAKTLKNIGNINLVICDGVLGIPILDQQDDDLGAERAYKTRASPRGPGR